MLIKIREYSASAQTIEGEQSCWGERKNVLIESEIFFCLLKNRLQRDELFIISRKRLNIFGYILTS